MLLLLLLAAADSKRPRASPESCFFAAGEAAALVALGERHRGPDGVRQSRGALCSAPQRQATARWTPTTPWVWVTYLAQLRQQLPPPLSWPHLRHAARQ